MRSHDQLSLLVEGTQGPDLLEGIDLCLGKAGQLLGPVHVGDVEADIGRLLLSLSAHDAAHLGEAAAGGVGCTVDARDRPVHVARYGIASMVPKWIARSEVASWSRALDPMGTQVSGRLPALALAGSTSKQSTAGQLLAVDVLLPSGAHPALRRVDEVASLL